MQILSHGVDFSGVDKDEASRWMAAVWYLREIDRRPLFDMLFASGAHVNGDSGFDDPLIVQVAKDPEQGVKELRYLLSIGVDPTRKDKHGKTALDIARERKRTDLIPLLENALKK